MARLIVNLNTGDIYGSISEAARATGADAGNISKVVSGSRRTAGGYTFAAIDPEKLEDTDLRAVKRSKLAGQTKAQQKRATQARQKSRQKVRQQERARKKAAAAAERQRRRTEPKSTTEARRAARASALKANEMLKQKEEKLSRAGARSLEDLARQMGATREGRFKTTGITGTEEAMKQMSERIKQILAEDEQKKKEEAARWQDIYRLKSAEQGEEMRQSMNNLADAFASLRQLFGRTDGRSQYKSIFTDIQKDAEHMTPEQIQEVADLINNFVNGTKKPDEDELMKIYTDWATETGVYDEEDDDEEDDEFIIYGD